MNIIRPIFSLAVFLALWTIALWAFGVPERIVPSPWGLAAEFWFLLTQAGLLGHIPVTVLEIVIGFAVGCVLGIATAVLFDRLPAAETLLSPVIVLIQTAPKISIAPLLLLWLGLGLAPKVVLVVIVTFFPVLANMLSGLRGLDPNLRMLMQLLRLSPWQRLRRVELPQSLPFLFAGMKVAATLSVTAAVIGELMGARAGLGYLLRLGQETADVAMVGVAVILLSLIGYVFYLAIEWAERRLLAWHASAAHDLPIE